MEINQYQNKAVRTMASLSNNMDNQIHMLLGISTELGEIQDVFKKHIAYGKNLDLVNIKEEVGDLMWYVANFCTLNGWDLREILETNIKKLEFRYPEKFTSENALTRDLEKEREILENGSKV
jgi:NTP pyrophosphatase (non-canonical NTP hydrolase)